MCGFDWILLPFVGICAMMAAVRSKAADTTSPCIDQENRLNILDSSVTKLGLLWLSLPPTIHIDPTLMYKQTSRDRGSDFDSTLLGEG